MYFCISAEKPIDGMQTECYNLFTYTLTIESVEV